jgi:hypothetical protein
MRSDERKKQREQFRELGRFIDNYPPEGYFYGLPQSFTEDEWAELSLEQKLLSFKEDRRRLYLLVSKLEKEKEQAWLFAAMAAVSLVVLVICMFYYA